MTEKQSTPDETYSLDQAANWLHMSVNSVAQLIQSGKLRAAKPGKEYIIHIDDLRAFYRTLADEQTAVRRNGKVPEHILHAVVRRWCRITKN